MLAILERLLKKRGIKDVSVLSNDEKADFDRWNKVLSEGEISVEKIKTFCQQQIKLIESQWKNLDNSERKNERLIVMHVVYSAILEAIEAPKIERENLEKYLVGLIEGAKLP